MESHDWFHYVNKRLYSPLAGETNWMESLPLRRAQFSISLISPLAGETNWMESLKAFLKAFDIKTPHSLGKLIEWKDVLDDN